MKTASLPTIRGIRRLLRSGWSIQDIAAKYEVSEAWLGGLVAVRSLLKAKDSSDGAVRRPRRRRLRATLLCLDCGKPSDYRQRCRDCAQTYGARSAQYRIYQSNARLRGLEWSLSEIEANKLFDGRCHYCGTDPGPRYFSASNKTPYIDFLNGIDRIDSHKGYTSNNVVSACKICNRMKGTLSVKEFVRACRSVVVHNGLTET